MVDVSDIIRACCVRADKSACQKKRPSQIDSRSLHHGKEVLAWAIESSGIVPNYRDIGYTDFDVVLACLA